MQLHFNIKIPHTLKLRSLLILLVSTLVILACSRTKDTFTSRVYHQTLSRFNPLFNGKQAFYSGEQDLAKQHRDNFDEILPVFRYGEENQVSIIKPQMDKAIEKSTKVIQRHSMMIRNEQRNKYIDDSYLLIGKARFYKREYLEALETFNFVIQQFPDGKNVAEAKLWAAKTETQLNNYLSAKDKFEKIYRSEALPRELRAKAFASYAQLEINQGNKTGAFQLLSQAVDRSKDKQEEIRWLFIMGQLQAAMGNDYEASQLFLKVIKKGPPYELLFAAQLNRARNYDTDLQNPEDVFDELEAMLKDDKNFDNRDQIYYVMAEVAERLGDDELMLDYLKKSVRASTGNVNQKGLSYLKIAETKFDNRRYPLAAAYYDSSFTSFTAGHPRYEEVKLKKESLDELVKNLAVIETEDSLQQLAGLTEKQLKQKLNEIISNEDRQQREREERENNPFFDSGNAQSLTAMNQAGTKGGQWYFYNQGLRSSGERDFMNTWGNRKLEDNWRRSNKEMTGNFADNATAGNDQEEAKEENGQEASSKDSRLEKYRSNIPATPEAIAASNQKIVEAYFNLAGIYKNDLKDLQAAETELKTLLKRYPHLSEKGRAWYSLYRINVALSDDKEAQQYRQLILDNLPESEFAALLNGGDPESGDSGASIKAFYKKTYASYNEGAYRQSLNLADSGLTAYGTTDQGPRFMLLKAFSQGKLGDKEQLQQTLSALMVRYPNSEQSEEAQLILNQLKAKEAQSQQAASVANPKGQEEKSKYSGGENEEYKYIVVVPNTKGLVNNVTIALSDFSKKYFSNMTLKTKAIYISSEEQMVMVSGLPNQRKAKQFMQILEQQATVKNLLEPAKPKHFVISNSDFTQFYRDKDFSGYLDYYNTNF